MSEKRRTCVSFGMSASLSVLLDTLSAFGACGGTPLCLHVRCCCLCLWLQMSDSVTAFRSESKVESKAFVQMLHMQTCSRSSPCPMSSAWRCPLSKALSDDVFTAKPWRGNIERVMRQRAQRKEDCKEKEWHRKDCLESQRHIVGLALHLRATHI